MSNTFSEFTDVFQLSSDDFEAMLRSAAECYTNGALGQAITILAGLITIEKSDTRPFKLLGSCFLLQQNHEKAETTYARALELDPEDPYTLVALGELRLKGLKIVDAVPLFEKLFELDPGGKHPAANRGRKLVQDYYEKLSG